MHGFFNCMSGYLPPLCCYLATTKIGHRLTFEFEESFPGTGEEGLTEPGTTTGGGGGTKSPRQSSSAGSAVEVAPSSTSAVGGGAGPQGVEIAARVSPTSSVVNHLAPPTKNAASSSGGTVVPGGSSNSLLPETVSHALLGSQGMGRSSLVSSEHHRPQPMAFFTSCLFLLHFLLCCL